MAYTKRKILQHHISDVFYFTIRKFSMLTNHACDNDFS